MAVGKKITADELKIENYVNIIIIDLLCFAIYSMETEIIKATMYKKHGYKVYLAKELQLV